MSLWRDELKPSATATAAILVLGAVAIASLSRVFVWPNYLAWALVAVAIGASFAYVLGQRSLGIAFGGLIVVVVATLPALFLEGDKSSLLPTWGALTDVRALISEGLGAIPKATPPVQAEPKFVILVWLAFTVLAFLAAAWIVVRRPVGAVISILAVVTFTGSVGDGTSRPWFGLAAVVATGAFFLADGRDRISRWGGTRTPMPSWLGFPTLAIAGAIAVLAPVVLGEEPIIELRSAIRPRVVIIKPLSDIQQQLKLDPPLEVMRVSASQPEYWRLTGLDDYDGSEWTLEARPKDVVDGQVPVTSPATTGPVIEQTYRLTALLAPWLPAVYSAKTVHTDAIVQVDTSSQTLLSRERAGPGLVYTVTSQLPEVTTNVPVELKPSSDGTEKLFGSLASKIVDGASTPLDMARRLETHFRSYTYNEDVAGGHTVARLQRFLADRTGYCEQFAATMTLMLRGLGIDARVGVGFLPGAQVSGSEYVVSTDEAHAWVEANIPGAGWFTFDPTPGRSDPASVPPELSEQETEIPDPVPQVTSFPAPTPVSDEIPSSEEAADAGVRIPSSVLWAMAALAAISATPVAKTIRRRRRRSLPPRDSVAGAFADLVDSAQDLGRKAAPSETLREFVTRAMPDNQPALDLAGRAAAALYATTEPDATAVRSAWLDQARAAKHLRSSSSAFRRVVAPFDPRSLIRGRITQAVRGAIRSIRRAGSRTGAPAQPQTPTGFPSSI